MNQCLFAFPHVNFSSLEFCIKELRGSYFSLRCPLAWLEVGHRHGYADGYFSNTARQER